MVKIYLETDEICTEYEVDLASSVLQFKAEIEALQGLEEDLRWLEFEGEILRDESRDLESYSINEGSVVHAGAPRYQPEIRGGIGGGGGPGWYRTRSKEGRALHDWDGNMKHPKIAGLPLRRGMSVLVTDTRESEAWCRVRSNKTDVYLPRQFVM
ncbi:hypothetical protein C8R46DRAFT_264264 [Mycena filopes]|nr:hypothetical protein C8R46DRAFT_264264 [Mycena filopes]